MAYEFSDIRTSQEIFYHLLMKQELREEDEPSLSGVYGAGADPEPGKEPGDAAEAS